MKSVYIYSDIPGSEIWDFDNDADKYWNLLGCYVVSTVSTTVTDVSDDSDVTIFKIKQTNNRSVLDPDAGNTILLRGISNYLPVATASHAGKKIFNFQIVLWKEAWSWGTTTQFSLLGAFANSEKATISFVLSVCPSACNNSAPRRRILTKFHLQGSRWDR
jgi:hypothetical protein